ncbi:MAG: hypothetical protein KA712_07695 [Myxococcales bacterium]|nr:hypothetical protein [Myxococcales bacterium]
MSDNNPYDNFVFPPIPGFEATENGSYRLIINPKSAAIRIRFCPQDKCRTKTLRL